jgi:hypothetical protein
MADKLIDFSRYRETEEVCRQANPERVRPQAERERAPDYSQRRSEREGRSEWSGGSFGGGIWNGRSR